MEFLRRNSDYALRCLAYMAKFPRGEPISIERIAKKEDVPISFLRKVFQRLARAKIVDSQKGPRGGFYLLKKPSRLNLKKILEATQGRAILSDCLFEEDSCSHSNNCRVRKKMFIIQKEFDKILNIYTLSDFCEE